MKEIDRVLDYSFKTIERDSKLNTALSRIKESDSDLYQHSLNVARYSIMIGLSYKFDLDRLINLGVGCIMHDVGKAVLNPDILNKPDRLSEDEKVFVESHPSIGYRLVKGALVSSQIKNIVRQHHEKINSLGYPDALGGDKLSIDVQIATIADIFDALTSKRSYRDPATVEEAFNILYEDKGLNRVVVEIFEGILKKNNITGIIA